MSNIPFDIDYYILGGEGELLDARNAQIFAVDSETSFADVEELVNEHYGSVETLGVMSALKFLPAPSTKPVPVDVAELLTAILHNWSGALNKQERMAILELRDNL